MKYFGLILIGVVTIFFYSCKEDNPLPPENQPQVNLTLEDVSCREAWIKLSINNVSFPADVELYKDSSLAETISLSNTDSLLYIDSLLPNQSYEFHTTIHSYNHTITSDPLIATTMDTTSHTFTTQSREFGGQAGNCALYDVAILNENSIWAVGSIDVPDGQGGTELMNAVYWNGNQWNLKSIKVYWRGQYIPFPLTGVITFSDTDIWVIGSLPIHGDGENWTVYDLRTTLDPTISFIGGWGKSPNDIYFVGEQGSIGHYKDGNWYKLESGISDVISDVWGVEDEEGKWTVYCISYNQLFKITDSDEVIAIETPDTVYLSYIWSKDYHKWYSAGIGINLYLNNEWLKLEDLNAVSAYAVKGYDYNEIFGIASPGSIIHDNGFSWQRIYMNTENTYYYLDVYKDIAVAVGWSGQKAIITSVVRN